MRRTLRLAAAGTLPLLLLTACGSDSSSSSSASGAKSSTATCTAPPTASAAEVSSLSTVTVDTKDAKKPVVTLAKKPFKVAKTETKVLKAGTGATLTNKDLATVNYTLVNGTSGKEAANTFASKSVVFDLTDTTLVKGLSKALIGQKVGSTLTIAVPPSEAFGCDGQTSLGITENDTMVFYMDIISATQPLTEATGTPVAPKAGLPTVSVPAGKGKEATITMPNANPPSTLVSQDLITGKGAKVAEGDTVMVSYTGVIWANGKKGTAFDSTAKQGGQPTTFQLAPGQLINGWVKGLVGKTVGSRVLLVVPPADGYGTAGNTQASIKGTDTLVFVVDILAIT
ncbi:peptidylprolyl isomerase [Branchiibius hedensis]|uniref:peptidylprolyl isomerase n=1 Tax=Branchiibius hedensis TaxID=672460 RepID=A0A2Y9BTF2_9MICO|nr:FKBP-type peptidyl-prolyl cis-trans isomerase [Branchiibius hedensis]PWJ25137.1 peptidylprolyl isomerase [Branchiibius hedensis]SSA33952.1 peptidylprolyl isomerase [Branchiibius hedensis]